MISQTNCLITDSKTEYLKIIIQLKRKKENKIKSFVVFPHP